MRMIIVLLMMVSFPVNAVVVGAQQPDKFLPLLAGKKVAAVVNQTSRTGALHLVDFLLQNKVELTRVMAPEHGFRGTLGAGEQVVDDIDVKTGLPIISLYGKNKKPTAAMLKNVDVIVFDIQDVGTRFYTYISTLHYVLEAAAEHNKAVVILDRPNPNGRFVDGPVRQPGFESFVGLDPIPVLHGMTVGELAKMMQGENWISHADKLSLSVVAVKDYTRTMSWSLPVPPSPNLPNDAAVRLYPSLCFFEATAVSIGRGTDLPFQLIGHDSVRLGAHRITPQSRSEAPAPKLEGKQLWASMLAQQDIQGLDLGIFIKTYQQFRQAGEPFFTRPDFMDKLAGTDSLRKAIEAGHSEKQIRADWQPRLAEFKRQRQPYLLYP